MMRTRYFETKWSSDCSRLKSDHVRRGFRLQDKKERNLKGETIIHIHTHKGQCAQNQDGREAPEICQSRDIIVVQPNKIDWATLVRDSSSESVVALVGLTTQHWVEKESCVRTITLSEPHRSALVAWVRRGRRACVDVDKVYISHVMWE